jgi:hypothetical protein
MFGKTGEPTSCGMGQGMTLLSGTPRFTNATSQQSNPGGPSTTSGGSTSTSGSPIHTSTIAAIVVGCVAFILILFIAWLVLHSRRRRRNAGLTAGDAADASMKQKDADPLTPTPPSLDVHNQSGGASSQATREWTIPPSILKSRRVSHTIPTTPSRAAESSYTPGISYQNVAREVLAEQEQGIGPLSPSTMQDTEDTQSVDEERVNRVILEVARRMGGVERSGLPPDYADLH